MESYASFLKNAGRAALTLPAPEPGLQQKRYPSAEKQSAFKLLGAVPAAAEDPSLPS